MNTLAKLRKIEDKLKTQQRNNRVIWPILGGASGGEPYRGVTQAESEMLVNRGDPVPICVALSSEKKFLEYLNDEYINTDKKH